MGGARWSETEDKIMTMYYGERSVERVSDILAIRKFKRTPYAIKHRARQLGLSNDFPPEYFSVSEFCFLTNAHPQTVYKAIKEKRIKTASNKRFEKQLLITHDEFDRVKDMYTITEVDENKFSTIYQASNRIGCSEAVIYKRVKEGFLKSERFNLLTYVYNEDIDKIENYLKETGNVIIKWKEIFNHGR